MEPFPANSKTVQKKPRKRRLEKNEDVQIAAPPMNLAQSSSNTYMNEELSEKGPNVKEVYVCPTELQGMSSLICSSLATRGPFGIA